MKAKHTDASTLPATAQTTNGPDGPPREGRDGAHNGNRRTDQPTAGRGTRATIGSASPRLGIVGVLIGVFVLFSVLLPQAFPTLGNIRVMLGSEAVILILALSVTLTLRLGDLDLSFAATMSFANALVSVLLVEHGWSPAAAVVIALVAGGVIGAANGVMVVVLRMNSFVSTLGTQTALLGLTYAITQSHTVVGLPSSILNFARDRFLGLPAAVWYGWLIAALLWVCYEHTAFGRYLLFVGGNSTAARLAGIRVDSVRFRAYVLSGILFAFAGVVLTGFTGSADPSISFQYLLPPLAGAFLGTTTIQLGRFNVIGTIIGIYLLLVISTGLQLLGAASWTSDLFNGLALIGAVAFGRLASRRSLHV